LRGVILGARRFIYEGNIDSSVEALSNFLTKIPAEQVRDAKTLPVSSASRNELN